MRELHIALSAAIVTFLGCASDPAPGPSDPATPTPPPGVTTVELPASGLGGLARGGVLTLTGTATDGTASVVAAPYAPIDREFVDVGTGALAVTVAGQTYAGTDFSSVATSYTEATDYAMLAGFRIHDVGGGEVVEQFVIHLRAADVVAGADVALDGEDRFVVFLAGDPNQDAPAVAAVAVSGTVHVGAGSIAPGATISADVSASFVEASWDAPTGPGPSAIEAGTYQLTTGPVDVYCDGSLAGQEAAFAGITAAALGAGDGAITLADSADGLVASGAPVAAFFTADTLLLEDQDGLQVGYAASTGAAGPLGTTRSDDWLILDGESATTTQVDGALMAGYQTDDRTGYCQVGVYATLTR